MKIVAVDSIPLHLRFLPEVAPHQLRAVSHGSEVTLYRVELEGGVSGWGDALGSSQDAGGYLGAMRSKCCTIPPTVACRWLASTPLARPSVYLHMS